MEKASAILLDVLDEMEFLAKTMSSAQLYYESISVALAMVIKETKLCLLRNCAEIT